MRQPQNVFADVPKRAIDEGIDGAAHFGRLKGSQVEPTDAVHSRAASRRAIRAHSRNKRPAVVADARARELGALQHSNWTAAGG